jgi:hypothetical protein
MAPNAQGMNGVMTLTYPSTFPNLTISGGLSFISRTTSNSKIYTITSGSGTISW